MFDKIAELSNENEKLKKESAENSEWLKVKNKALDNLTIAYNKLVKEHKELKSKSVSFDCHKKLIEDNEKLAEKNHKLEIKVSSLETELKDCKYMYENKLKNTEATLHSIAIDNHVCDSFIKTLRSQAEEDANKMKELRLKYEAVLKANEKLAAENQRIANDPETIKLNNELMTLKKQYRDLNNAYKSQKNELTNRKKLLADVATELNNIYEHMEAEASPIKMLAIDLRSFML